MNVLASSSAHKRYFADADEIFIDIASRSPSNRNSLPTMAVAMGHGSSTSTS
jgi:hypothetical protein